MAEDLLRRDISDEMKESYINYAMSVIIGRALPDVRDGAETCPPSYPLGDAPSRPYSREGVQQIRSLSR